MSIPPAPRRRWIRWASDRPELAIVKLYHSALVSRNYLACPRVPLAAKRSQRVQQRWRGTLEELMRATA
jgi:hypothetical protein